MTEFVVTAFQRHFRPERVDGRIDQSTITTLERLAAALPARRAVHERAPRTRGARLAGPLDRLDVRAVLVLIACCACWGVNQVAIKIANAGISPILQVGLRSVFAGRAGIRLGAAARRAAVRARRHAVGRHCWPA